MPRTSLRSNRLHRQLWLVAILALCGAALAAPASVSAGTALATFFVTPGDICVFGETAPNVSLEVELRNKKGKLKGTNSYTTGDTGDWAACFPKRIKVGDRLKATIGAQSRTFIVKPLKFSINRATNVVKGKAAKKSSVQISATDCHSDWNNCLVTKVFSAPTNAKGKFSRNLSSQFDIRGDDLVSVSWTSPMGDVEYIVHGAPKVYVIVGDRRAEGRAKPNAKVKVKLFNKKGKKRAVAKTKAGSGGDFDTGFGTNKKPVLPALGNTIRSNIATDAKFEVKDFKPSFNVNTDVITATCWPNSPWRIGVRAADQQSGFSRFGITNGAGNLTLNTQTAAGWNLKSGDEIEIDCRTPAGDQLDQEFVVP